ncbi:pneumococcal-type histidine triad protein [Gemella haemolysans]|uniref:pneumococcal-type histidine triad protein n=1 Tax=Gemella haemolysans TaxID=1379 RepID=UPI00123845A0|nr:pneumococcal-type histidine triad protein [Gemella haemolysans]KAA8707546.1 pneumococcal-type histidine triad protein [Gemella haemolysans]UBH81795.1 pneumococcal-type histidine triad protein [Gemella haemolysans]
MNKKNMIITGACGSLVIGLSAFAGYEYGKHQAYETTPLVQNTAQAKKINYSDKVSSVVVSEITEDGYVTLHGDHSHYEKGLVPYNAKILDSLVYKNKDYKLKNEDIQYELAEGYVIKVNGKYYYYPKEGITQNNVVDENTGKEISAHAHHHHHHGESSESKGSGDNYTFNPKDVVSETQDGYVVRHGDHFHYIKKSELSNTQLSQVKEAGVNPSLASSAAGVSTPTSDGYIFKGESDIIGRNSFGFIVQHGNHQHIIPYSQLRGTQWEYLLNNQGTTTNNTNTTVVNTPKTNIVNDNHHDHHEHSSEHGDDYKFDPKDIVAEDENGYTVRHGDHFHYIPKNKVDKPAETVKPAPAIPTPSLPEVKNVEKPVEAVKPAPVIPTPSLPEVKNVEKPVKAVKPAPVIPTPSLPEVKNVEKPVEAVKPAPVIPTPSLPEVKDVEKPKVEETVVRPSVLSFAGVQFKTSDGFILNDNTVGTPTSLGLVIDHNGHQHFVFYKQLVNSKFEKLIPEKYLKQAKKEYKELEDKVTEKINYLSSKNNIDKNTIKYVSTAQGDALSYDGKTTLLDNINVNDVAVAPTEKPAENNKEENNTEKENKDNYSEEVTKKINHLAKILGIDPKLIKLVETENGQALTYPHGDHSHTVLLNAIHIDETDVNITEEIQKQINYIAEVYGVPKEAVKVTKDFFVFNEPAHAYDPTHIHPYLIPREKFHIPEVTGDDEVDFENELLALSKRTGIPADKIKRDGDKFVIPHGDHDHFVKILSKGADIYYKNRIPNITGNYVSGDFDKETVFKRIEELKANNLAKHSNDKKQANRVNRALDQLRATIEELPTNSTNGYLEMLNNFDKKYIQEEANSDTSKNDELVKKYNTLLNRIKDTDIEKYGLSKTDLTNELNEASSNKDANTLNKVSHMLDELQKFEDRESITTVSYIKYFLENIDSDKIDNQLREELASLVKDSYESQAFITRTPMRTLVTRLINAKNALHYALEHNESSKVEFGENYNKLNETDSDGTTLRSSADQFSKEANDPSFPIEFSNAKYDKADFEKYANKTTEKSESTKPTTEAKPEEEKDNNTNNNSNTGNQPNSEVSTPKEENNTTDNKKVELTPEETAKVNLLAGIFKLSPDSLNVIETPYGKAVNFTLGGKAETILINDIDRLLAALLANAKPKESSTENENGATLNSENEVSNSNSDTTTVEPKNNTEKEETSNNTTTPKEETSNNSTEEK